MEKYKKIIDLADEMIQHRDGEKFHHKKVYQDDKIYIYQVNGKWFEVFKKTIRQKREKVNGELKNIEGVGRVVYPSDNNFGFWAWNCHDKSCITGILRGNDYGADEIDAILGSFADNPYAHKDRVGKYQGTEKLPEGISWSLYN